MALERNFTTLNRDWWDRLSLLHGADSYYDVQELLAGGLSLDERERGEVKTAVGDVMGTRILHLQCHIGLDTLSWARLGACVTGIDFSATALRRARQLAQKANLPATFIQADAQRLPRNLAGEFDLVFASYGIFYWIESIHDWMQAAATALAPGGKLVVIETHPLVQMFQSIDPVNADFPYSGAEPRRRRVVSTYSGHRLPEEQSETVGYAHGIGEIVTAAADAGFHLDSLSEYMDRRQPSSRPGTPLTQGADGRYRLIIGGQALPVAYGLRATKGA